MTDRPVESRDEIELIEILRAIWRWKYLILIGTVVFVLVAGVVSFTRPKMYRISMVLKPGLVEMDARGRKITIDSPANMKALLEAGTLNNKIRNHLKTLNIKNTSPSLRLRVSIPKSSNILKISYETPDVDTGIQILGHLPNLLLKEYSEEIEQFDNKYQQKINSRLEEISFFQNEMKITKNNVSNIQKRLNELKLELQILEKNNNILINKRNSIAENRNGNSVNMTLLYSNTIQKNLELMNIYKNQFFDYLSRKERAEFKLMRIQEEIELTAKQLEDLKKNKNSIEYIQVLQAPTSSARPVKPKTKVAMMLAFVVGLFTMVFLAFFLEYVFKYRIKEHDQNTG